MISFPETNHDTSPMQEPWGLSQPGLPHLRVEAIPSFFLSGVALVLVKPYFLLEPQRAID